jgi:hypothetical protein
MGIELIPLMIIARAVQSVALSTTTQMELLTPALNIPTMI